MDDLERLVQRKNSIRRCPSCGRKMSYTSVTGTYKCPECGTEEKDTYGRMKDLLKDRPSLTKAQMSSILGVPLREINKYIKDGVLDNPNTNFKA